MRFYRIFFCQSVQFTSSVYVEHDEDVIRKSIVYDKKTPDVFYCPQEDPNGMACLTFFYYVVDSFS